jgi:outer membrane lipoprotein
MSTHSGLRWIFVVLLLGIVSGCASSPISQTYRHEAQGNFTIGQVRQNPYNYIGVTVIWGGQIIATNNTAEGTEVVVLAMPLDSDDYPVLGAGSEGRFIAQIPGFLDPEIYQRGKLITLAGQITGTAVRPLGQVQYAYPVIGAKQYYLWTEERNYSPYHGPYGPNDSYYPYWDWSYDWYWGGFPRFRDGGRGGHERGERGEHFEGGEHGGHEGHFEGGGHGGEGGHRGHGR